MEQSEIMKAFNDDNIWSLESTEESQCQMLLPCAISVMKNYLGQPAYPFTTPSSDLYSYIELLCEDSGLQDRKELEEKCLPLRPDSVQVKVTIKEAVISHPKFKDFSHVYCKIWVQQHQEEFTSIKKSSSILLWNESFAFNIPNYSTDAVHVQVWSAHPNGLGEVLHKLNLTRRQPTFEFSDTEVNAVYSGNYMVGKAVECITNIPSVGGDIWLTLQKGEPKTKIRGKIQLSLELGVKASSIHILDVQRHLYLLKRCFEITLLTHKPDAGTWKTWIEVFPFPALTLIHQHGLQNGLTVTETEFCSLLVAIYLKINQADQISFCLIYSLLKNLNKYRKSEPMDEQLEQALHTHLSKFSDYMQIFLENMHDKFYCNDKDLDSELKDMLRCLTIVQIFKSAAFSVFIDQLVEEESAKWYIRIINEHKENLQDDEKITETLMKILGIFSENQIFLDETFRNAWKTSYTEITCKRLDFVAETTIKPIIKHLVSKVKMIRNKEKRFNKVKELLQMYMKLKDMTDYMSGMFSPPRQDLAIQKSAEWFGDQIILEWFQIVTKTSRSYIKSAVIADKMEPLSSVIKHGTSVSDALQVIDQMVLGLWMNMVWNDQFYTHTALIEAIRACTIHYAKTIIKHIHKAKFFNHESNFHISQKLCVSLSNIYALFEHLHSTNIKIRTQIKAAEEEFSFAMLDPLDIVEDDLQESLISLYKDVVKKVQKRLNTLCKNIIQAQSAPSQGNAIYELYRYIDVTLEMLYENLKCELFKVMLKETWATVIKCLLENLKKGTKKCCIRTTVKKFAIYGVLSTLIQLQSVFSGEEKGLSNEEMKNKKYSELNYFLRKHAVQSSS